MVDYGYDIARDSFCRHKHYISQKIDVFISLHLPALFFSYTHTMVFRELVQLYLDNKANPNLETFITRARLPSIISVRLSGKHFSSNNYPVHKFCCMCLRKESCRYKKTKTSNFCEKCNFHVCKKCFEQYHTRSQPKRKYII